MAEKVVQLLLPLNEEEEALQLWNELQVRRDQLLGAVRQATPLTTDNANQASSLPVEFSVVTEERPSGWLEGCAMTDEMALRTFLHYFRTDLVLPEP